MSQDYGKFSDTEGRTWWVDGNGWGFKIWSKDCDTRIVINDTEQFESFVNAVRYGALDMFDMLIELHASHHLIVSNAHEQGGEADAHENATQEDA